MISEEYKSIYIHIPKTGGTTIGNILHPNQEFEEHLNNTKYYKDILKGEYYHGAEHKRYNEYKDILKTKSINDYFVFSFIRNPYSRIFSYWKMGVKHYSILKNPSVINIINIYGLGDFFKQFTLDNFRRFAIHPLSVYMIGGLMCEYILPSQANFIGRFENFNKDLIFVLDKISIDYTLHQSLVLNKNSINRQEFKMFYNIHTRNQVYKLFEKDFDVFKYPKSVRKSPV